MPKLLSGKFKSWGHCLLGASVLFGISQAALAEDAAPADDTEVTIEDPYETYNRHTFAFNDALDTHILQPVARFYNKVMPKPLNKGVHNFFLNLNTLSTVGDDLLQLNIYQATNDFWRLAINSTVGIGGLFDIATRMNLPFYENDFGMTLATWGYRKSNYFILPFYGSYTVRDAMSLPVDYYALSAYRYIRPPSLGYGIYAVSVVDWRAQALKYNDLIDAAALDKYVFVRNAYLQRRAYQLEENRHLGMFERDRQSGKAVSDEQNGAPGSQANIDESANLGKPANTDTPETKELENNQLTTKVIPETETQTT